MDPNVYYLIRNSIGETLSATNRTYDKLEDYEHNDLLEVYTIVLLLGTISMFVLILCLVIIIIPTIIKIENAYSSV